MFSNSSSSSDSTGMTGYQNCEYSSPGTRTANQSNLILIGYVERVLSAVAATV